MLFDQLFYVMGEVHIDPFKLEEYLSKRKKIHCTDDESLYDLIVRKFGKKCAEYIKSLI